MDNLKKDIEIYVASDEYDVQLRAIDRGDLANLRHWKNEQREYFFFKGVISLEQQQEWFVAYQQRSEDYMFVISVGGVSVGCMGIRLLDASWDVYNVILGSRSYGGKGIMSKGFRAMLHFAFSCRPNQITLQVLKENPAVSWYQKNGFIIVSEQPTHFCMTYQSENFTQERI